MITTHKKAHSRWLVLKGLSQLTRVTDKTAGLVLKDQSDEVLVAAYQNGDAQAFQILLARHQRPVYNFLYKYLRQFETVEDAFQEVFLRVVRSIHEYKPSAKFTTWLYTIARNYCIDLIRKEKFRKHTSLSDKFSDDSDSLEEQIGSEDASADQTSSARELEKMLYEILDGLNPEQKEVFLLRESQGLQFDEIARITKTSANTVKSRMRYALQAIQKKFLDKGIG